MSEEHDQQAPVESLAITVHVRVVTPSDLPVERDEAMIAESRRLAALGKVRPIREFLNERRSRAKH